MGSAKSSDLGDWGYILAFFLGTFDFGVGLEAAAVGVDGVVLSDLTSDDVIVSLPTHIKYNINAE